jgi:hypothetical protein
MYICIELLDLLGCINFNGFLYMTQCYNFQCHYINYIVHTYFLECRLSKQKLTLKRQKFKDTLNCCLFVGKS